MASRTAEAILGQAFSVFAIVRQVSVEREEWPNGLYKNKVANLFTLRLVEKLPVRIENFQPNAHDIEGFDFVILRIANYKVERVLVEVRDVIATVFCQTGRNRHV
jgi:hypothetical protein